MISFGEDCQTFYSLGEEVYKIYSLGEIVWQKENLPYIPLDWIESSGSQYIELGYIPNSIQGRTEIVSSTNTVLGTTGLWGYINQRNINNRNSIGISEGKWFAGVGKTVFNKNAVVNEVVKISFDRTDNEFKIDDSIVNFTDGSVTSTYQAFLFARNSGTTPYGTSYNGKVYSFKEYNESGDLIRSLIPAKLKSDNSIGMWDLVEDIFYPNAGTGEFIYKNSEIETYLDIEYVEMVGAQWIDTGLPNTGDYIIEDEFMVTYITTPSGDGGWIIGGRVNSQNGLGIFRGTSGFFNMYGANSVAYASNVNIGEWVNMYFSRTKLTTTVNGDTRTYPVSGGKLVPIEYETNILLGKNQVNYANTGDDPRNMYGKRRYTKITDATTGVVLREFKPVKGEQTGVVGLLDITNNKFYPSIGSQPFIAGNLK